METDGLDAEPCADKMRVIPHSPPSHSFGEYFWPLTSTVVTKLGTAEPCADKMRVIPHNPPTHSFGEYFWPLTSTVVTKLGTDCYNYGS